MGKSFGCLFFVKPQAEEELFEIVEFEHQGGTTLE